MPPGVAVEQLAVRLRRARRGPLYRNLAWIVGVSVLLIGLAFYLPTITSWWRDIVELVMVAGFSGLVGYGELVSRYRDNPGRLFAASGTPAYILVNVAAGIAALVVVRHTHVIKDLHPLRLFEAALASFGAVAFFRTSFFTARIGGNDVGIGPSALLQSLLGTTDRMVNRDQAQGRASDVADIMKNIDFNTAMYALPALCFTLVENLTPDDQKAVGEQIKALAATKEMTDDTKAIVLGVYLIRQVGADVLELSVRALGSNIAKRAAADPKTAA